MATVRGAAGYMATARVATTIRRQWPVLVYGSGDPGGRHARLRRHKFVKSRSNCAEFL